MQELPDQGLLEFVYYQRDNTNRTTTRHQRKVQKIEKRKHDMNDPQMKKQRHKQRRTQDKNKLKKQLQGMNEQQARKFLDAKKQKKKLAKQKILKSLEGEGQQIYVDMVYEKNMNQKENKSLAIQIELIMKAIKHIENPPAIHLCSTGGLVEKQLQKMNYNFWTLKSHKEDIAEVAALLNKKMVYLSPDAPEQLQSVDDDTAYVIGGLVDRTVLKYASLNRSQKLGIPARHLPIRQFMKNRSCLNLDHVVKILCKFKKFGNWQQAFQFGAPKRWKKGEGQFSIKPIPKQYSESQDEQNEQSQDQKQEDKSQNKLKQNQYSNQKKN